MQQEVQDGNPERQKEGYPPSNLVGWAANTPHYDKATHKLYWAKDLKFGTESGGHPQLQYPCPGSPRRPRP